MKDLIFAKLFMIGDDRQVLVQRLFDADEDTDIVEVSTSLDGCHMRVNMAYTNQSDRDAAFEEFNQQKAENWFAAMDAKMK